MSKLKGKLARRIMAIVLSGAMVMSNMSAYAAELSTETTTEAVSEVEETAAAEPSAEPAKEEEAASSDENKAETKEAETSVAESSESTTDKVGAEEVKSEAATSEEATEATTDTATDETESSSDNSTEKSTEAETEKTEETKTTVETEKETSSESEDSTETATDIEEETTEAETETETEKSEDVEVDNKADDPNVLNISNLDAVDITEPKTFGIFTVNPKSSDDTGSAVTIDTNSKKGEDLTFTKRLKLGGSGKKDARSVSFHADSAGEFIVYAMSSSGSADRIMRLYDASGTQVGEDYSAKGKVDNNLIPKGVYTINSAGDYYFASTNGGANIYYAEFKASSVVPSTPIEWNVSDSDAGDITEPKDFNGFTVNPKSSDDTGSAVTIDTNSKKGEDLTFTKRLKLGGSGKKDARSVSFHADSAGEFIVYAMSSSGSADRIMRLYDASGTQVGEDYSAKGKVDNNLIPKGVYTINSAGDYYFASTNGGANIYYVKFTPGDSEPEPIDRGNWETDVADPEIVSVLYNAGDASIKVTAKGVVNKEGKGADSIVVQMYDMRATDGDALKEETAGSTKEADGYQVSFDFTPEDSANYIFRAVLKRGDDKDADGNVTATYTDKVSAFSDPVAFKLPLSAPSISLVKNMGKDANGKGVIDVSWEKVKEAEDYTLYVNAQDGTELYKQDSIEGLSAQVSGLEIGTTVNVTAKAVRGEGDESPLSDAKPVEVSGVEAKTYTFNGLDYVDEASSTGVNQNPGRKLGTEDYFSVYIADGTPANGTLLRTASNNTLCFLQVYQAAGSGLRFTTWGSSSATFTVASTGSSNWSVFGLMDSEGNLVKAEKVSGPSQPAITYGNAYAIQTTGLTTIDYIGLEPGTYTFLTPQVENPQNGVNGRGGRIHSAIINDEGEMPERGSWEAVEAPAISEVSYVRGQGTIEVKASGYIGLYGADALKVEMLDKDGEVVESNVNAQDSTVAEDGTVTNPVQTFTFTPKASGAYSFRASLTRSNETDKPMTDSVDDWKITDFVLPLKTPSVGAMTNIADTQDGKGGLEVIFTGVDEADYYIIAAYKNNEFNKENAFVDLEVVQEGDTNKLSTVRYEEGKDSEYTVRLEGMDLGTCYVTAQAFRNSDSSLNLKAETTTIKRDETGKAVSTTEFTKKDGEETSIETSETDAETRNAIAVVRSKAANGSEKYTNGKNDTRWFHTVYGSNTSRVSYNRGAALDNIDHEGTGATPANGYKENVFTEGDSKGDLKSVTIWSENGRGKVVPATTDGLSLYYTALDPENNNFTLSALVDLKSWTYSNGQDGFGMMVSDTVGEDGNDGDVWMNAYQLVASKIEYSYRLPVLNADGTVAEPGAITNESGNGSTIMRYSMRLGLGWTAKLGATASDVAKIKAGTLTTPPNFTSDSGTLEAFAGENGKPTGNYNIAGNVSNANAAPVSAMGEGQSLLTKFRLQIQKYDNAYVLRYLAVDSTPEDQIDEADKLNTAKYLPINGSYYEVLGYKAFSDDNNNTLTQIDKRNIYVGFFAARNARIDVSQISLVTSTAGNDPYVVPTEVINPNANFVSEEMSNNENYDLIYSGNFDGTVTIFKGTDAANLDEVLVRGMEVKAGTRYTFTSKMEKGDNYFQFHAKPNDGYTPGENQILSNHDMQVGEPFKVVYNAFEGDTIYVNQNGAAVGTSDAAGNPAGSKENPTNIYDAVNHASVGQTILMAGGRYDLKGDADASRNLLVGRDHDGTPKAYITMKAEDPSNRPILDFGRKTIDKGSAFTIAGNYWRFQDFDVTGSIDGEKGIQLSGSHNVLQNIHTYLNGNTGLQISRYLGSDSRADWPSYNTILNCSSYMNYDAGYEDADGYAAKLTCGDGNKFVGCIAAYNADDGWDLFAKRESGNIGIVTIENCLAFNNGYLFGEEDYYGAGQDLIYRNLSQITKNTHLVPAGNGNGFKMGGDSMSGYHVLRNSIAFGNKSKGIDSNSCPDIQLYNSISFNNEADNVALYTGGAPNTDYYAENIVSIKDSNCRSGASTGDNPKPVGNQNLNKIYGSNNYYWNGSKSLNKAGEEFKASWFTHMNMEAAVFGSRKWQAISRDADGSINLHGFMEYTSDAPFDKFVGNTGEDSVLDTPIDIYVFADLYNSNNAKISDIRLSSFDKIKEEIPEYANYKWAEPNTSLAAFAGTAADFTVTYTGEGTKPDRTVCVNFIQFDGAQLLVTEGDEDGDGILDDSEEWTVEAVPVISPAVDPDPAVSGFRAEITEATKGLLKSTATAEGETYSGLRVSGGQKKFVNTKKNGTAKLTATVSLTVNGKTVKKNAVLDIKVKNAEGIVFDNVIAGSGTGQYADMIEWTSDDDDILVSAGAGTLTMENLHFANKAFGRGVKIKVNDTSVIKLTNTTKRGNSGVDATFSIVNKSGEGGTATVTVTSADDKTLVRNYVVTVRGDDLAWNEDDITIDKAKVAGVQLMVLAPFGHTIDTSKDIKVTKAYKGTKLSGTNYANMFNVTQQVKAVYELNTDAKAAGLKNTQLPNGTYTLVCEGYLAGEDSPMEFTPITVKVNETKPNLSLKQTKKVNLFYNNGTAPGTGALTAGSKYANVTLTMVDAKGNAINDNGYFRLAKTATGYDLVSIKSTSDNRRSPVKWNASTRRPEYRDVIDHSTVSIKAQFEGYYDAYSITKDFKIGVEYKKPKLQLKAVDKTIYTAIGMDGARVLIYDPVTEQNLDPATATIELVTSPSDKTAYAKSNKDFTIGEVTVNNVAGVKLMPKAGVKKGGTLALKITYDDWYRNDAVIVKQTIQINTKTPTLRVSAAKLNVGKSFVGNEQVKLPLVLSNSAVMKGDAIEIVSLAGKNSTETAFLNKYLNHDVGTDDEGNTVLLMNLQTDENGKFPATANAKGVYKMNKPYKNSYTCVLSYKLGNQTKAQTATFRLSLVGAKESVTVSTSGSINLANRLGSTVTLKPRMKNFTIGQVAGVTLTGDAANQFEIVEFDKATGATVIRAKETAVLRTGRYKILPKFTFDLGHAGTITVPALKPIYIKTVQSKLKISGLKSPLQVKLSSPKTPAKRKIAITSPNGAFITEMTQTSGLDNFTLSYDEGGGNVSVVINNRAGLKEGVTYKITAVIDVEGAGVNVKQQQITIPVKVIK